MTISTFSELETALSNWLGGRTDLSSRIDEWIAMFEARFNRTIRVREMEARYTATISQFLALPTGFAGFRRLYIDTSPIQVLQLVSPEWMSDNYISTSTGKPRTFSIIGSEIQFGPSPDSSYTIAGVYYTKLTALSASNTTNWLLTSHPDLYLYGSLVESQAYTNIDERFPIWQAKYDGALAELKSQDKRDRWSGSMWQARTGVGNP